MQRFNKITTYLYANPVSAQSLLTGNLHNTYATKFWSAYDTLANGFVIAQSNKNSSPIYIDTTNVETQYTYKVGDIIKKKGRYCIIKTIKAVGSAIILDIVDFVTKQVSAISATIQRKVYTLSPKVYGHLLASRVIYIDGLMDMKREFALANEQKNIKKPDTTITSHSLIMRYGRVAKYLSTKTTVQQKLN